MKNVFILILSGLIIGACQNNTTIIKGKLIEADPGEAIYLNELTPKGIVKIDSFDIKKNGRFAFKQPIDQPVFYQLQLLSGPSLSLILSPGEKVFIAANTNNFYTSKEITGPENCVRLNTLHDSLRYAVTELKTIERLYANTDSMVSRATTYKDSLAQQYHLIRERHHKFSTRFILHDLKSLVNVAALYQQYSANNYVFHSNKDLQFFKLVTDTLTKYYPTVDMVNQLRANYRVFLSEYNTQKLFSKELQVKEAVGVFDLVFPSPSGKNVALKSLPDNLVLLSFWGIGNELCVKNNKELVKIYNDYHKKGFEIYHVAITQSADQWLKVVHFEDFKWVNVCDTAYPNSASLSFYNVNNVPANYLIDLRKDEILGKDLSSKALDKALNYMLN